MQISSDLNPRRQCDNQFFLEGKYERTSITLQGKYLSSNFHFSFDMLRIIWDNYAILKNRGLKTLGNSIYSKIRHLLR